MYSMVLMVALSGSAEVPDWGRGGCYGGGYGGFAGCFGGYYGYGCHGTCYGYYAGGLGYGCYGSGYGGWGAGYGCYGSGYASWGCWGGSYGWGGFPYGTGWGLANATPVLIGIPGPPAGATALRAYYNPGNSPIVAASGQVEAGTPGSSRATLVVHLPADAKLTVDNTPTKATSDTRRFVTPPLEPGATYRYTLRAEVSRNGVKETTSRNVEVRAGQTSNVTLEFPGPQRANR
jgi:uncharacterized protein (TIGR03000 family)